MLWPVGKPGVVGLLPNSDLTAHCSEVSIQEANIGRKESCFNRSPRKLIHLAPSIFPGCLAPRFWGQSWGGKWEALVEAVYVYTWVKCIKHLGEALTIQFMKQITNIRFYFSQNCLFTTAFIIWRDLILFFSSATFCTCDPIHKMRGKSQKEKKYDT